MSDVRANAEPFRQQDWGNALLGLHRMAATIQRHDLAHLTASAQVSVTATCVCYRIAAPHTWDLRYSELPDFTTARSGELPRVWQAKLESQSTHPSSSISQLIS
jgi:hypothetical protein